MAYATTTDLARLGVAAAALASLDTDTIEGALEDASSKVDSFLRSRYAPPLLAPIPREIVTSTVHIANWMLLSVRGFNPANGADEVARTNYEDAIAWLRDLAKGLVSIDGLTDSTPAAAENGAVVASASAVEARAGARGWTSRNTAGGETIP